MHRTLILWNLTIFREKIRFPDFFRFFPDFFMIFPVFPGNFQQWYYLTYYRLYFQAKIINFGQFFKIWTSAHCFSLKSYRSESSKIELWKLKWLPFYRVLDTQGHLKNVVFLSSVPTIKPRYCSKVDQKWKNCQKWQKWQILLRKLFR